MKRAIAFALAFAIIAFTTPSLAMSEPVTKIKDGAISIISSPLEIVNHTKDELNASTFKPFGLMGGLLKGTVYSIKKLITGVVDIVTSPLHFVK